MTNFDSSTKRRITKLFEETIDLKEQERASNGRSARNLDRAAMIVARLMFDGSIEIVPGARDNGIVFETAIDAVFDMLERYELDSPEGEIVDVFHDGRDDGE